MVPRGNEPLPEHITGFKIPPAWTDVKYSTDPKAELLVTGKDAKGRAQYLYSEAHWAKQAEAKFGRVDELNNKFKGISKEIDNDIKNKNTREAAEITKLIVATGIRPGSDAETLARVKAYGATTLEGRHVVSTKDGVSLQFVGKKGVSVDIAITDKSLATMLKNRADEAGKTGRLFSVNSAGLVSYVRSLDGGKFTPKDFRTWLGTKSAMDAMKQQKSPSNEKEYKKAVRAVAKEVASRLGNTPTIALQSYINPSVFSDWLKGVRKSK
jgi:DNA topoisomerase-1